MGLRSYFKSILERERTTPDAWIVRGGLWVLSGCYSIGVRIRNWLYQTGRRTIHRPSIPIICIGNLTVGGTGKTPCVEYIARHLSNRGWGVVILSRGYGQDSGPNDEAMVLEQNLPTVPHLQGADRVALAVTAVEELESEVAILDDGFQHRRLHRDFDLVLIDTTRPLQNELLLPAGRLREPLSALKHANAIFLTRTGSVSAVSVSEQRSWLKRIVPNSPIYDCDHVPRMLVQDNGSHVELEAVKNQSIGVVSGIGNPVAFERTLTALGATILESKHYPDHHAYTKENVAELCRWADRLPPDVWVVTTQKDLVKLRLNDLGGRPLYALRIGFEILKGELEFFNQLDAALPELPSIQEEFEADSVPADSGTP